MSLRPYHKKRDFSKTPEPKGTIAPKPAGLFIIQKHAASHLHYDFRLELDGVLKSWAVPKGPSLDPKMKRLAIHVEDHPLEYGNFEGIIPKGQYGGGTVMLWDKGIWKSLDKNPRQAYKKGHLRFELQAEKLNGRWDLIQFKDEEKQWFLIKYNDSFAKKESDYAITKKRNKSVLSHESMSEIAKNDPSIWSSEVSHLPKRLKPSPFPEFILPQLATLVDQPPQGEAWLHEIKFDGYRILAFKQGNEVTLKSRNNIDWSPKFPLVIEAVKSLAVNNIILDGEVVLLDQQGKSDFQLLQNALKKDKNAAFVYYLFDIIYLEHYDLRHLPLLERKSILKNIISKTSPTLLYSDHILKNGVEVFEQACNFALEGIVSKRIASTYQSERNKDWLKTKCLHQQEFIIGGYTAPKNDRLYFGSLLLGVFNDKGQLEYSGNVGTGFSKTSLKEVYQQLLKNKGTANPFSSKPPGASYATWLQPNLIAEVEFTEWTKEARLRHPSFKGLRFDKKPAQVVREKEISPSDIRSRKNINHKITHPDKILYPEDCITKQDLLSYYEVVSQLMLPYLSKRPLTLLRCPENYSECFYQRHYNKTTPKALHPIDISNEKYIYLDNKEGLLSLVQIGVLEIHPWGSQISHLDQPDIIIFDLDPGPEVSWKNVVKAALDIKEHLAQLKLSSFVKSTGGKGLHVVIPIKPEYSWEEVKEFSHVFVRWLEKTKPKEYTSTMSKSKRKGKIFIDYLRNQRSATAIGVYSTRARLHAPVSTPLFWEELSSHKEENSYTIKTLPQRLSQLKEDPWHDFWTIKQSLDLGKIL